MLSGFLQAVDVYTLQSQRIAFVGILILQRSAYSGSNGVSMVLSGGSVGNIIKGPRFYPFTPSSLIGLSVVDGIITIPIAPCPVLYSLCAPLFVVDVFRWWVNMWPIF
jgi:hypothetical protein